MSSPPKPSSPTAPLPENDNFSDFVAPEQETPVPFPSTASTFTPESPTTSNVNLPPISRPMLNHVQINGISQSPNVPTVSQENQPQPVTPAVPLLSSIMHDPNMAPHTRGKGVSNGISQGVGTTSGAWISGLGINGASEGHANVNGNAERMPVNGLQNQGQGPHGSNDAYLVNTKTRPHRTNSASSTGTITGPVPTGVPSTSAVPTTNGTTGGLPNSYQPQPPSSSSVSVYPSLHLTPLNDTFVPKQISLNPPGSKIKIGRQTNAKTVPNDRNGYFDSKVLSRTHAEVWYEDGKVFIKDVKSSNGTFINGDRLSPESVESDPWELHTDDVVEFGIDIVSEDNKTIVHHKVSAKVFLVLNAEDAIASSRDLSAWFRSVGESPLHRRGGKVGIGFDHFLNRLQTEIQKSKETGTELNGLTSTMGDIHETMNGGISAPPPLAPHQIPPFPAPTPAPINNSIALPKDYSGAVATLQTQLNEAQTSLNSHSERMRNLESLLAEHENLKREVSEMRGLMEESKREVEEVMREREREKLREIEDHEKGRVSPVPTMLEREEEEEARRNTDTVRGLPIDALALNRGKGMEATQVNGTVSDTSSEKDRVDDLSEQFQQQNTVLTDRIEKLSVQLQEAAKLSEVLKSQHDEASTTIRLLEEKIATLETEGQKWQGWKSKFEAEWQQDKKAWEEEKEKLKKFVRDWEAKQEKLEEERSRQSQSDDSDWEPTSPSGESNSDVDTTKSGRSKRRRKRRGSSRHSKRNLNELDAPDRTRKIGAFTNDSESTAVGSTSGNRLTDEGSEASSSPPHLKPTSKQVEATLRGGSPTLWTHPETMQYLGAAGVIAVAVGIYTVFSKVKD